MYENDYIKYLCSKVGQLYANGNLNGFRLEYLNNTKNIIYFLLASNDRSLSLRFHGEAHITDIISLKISVPQLTGRPGGVTRCWLEKWLGFHLDSRINYSIEEAEGKPFIVNYTTKRFQGDEAITVKAMVDLHIRLLYDSIKPDKAVFQHRERIILHHREQIRNKPEAAGPDTKNSPGDKPDFGKSHLGNADCWFFKCSWSYKLFKKRFGKLFPAIYNINISQYENAKMENPFVLEYELEPDSFFNRFLDFMDYVVYEGKYHGFGFPKRIVRRWFEAPDHNTGISLYNHLRPRSNTLYFKTPAIRERYKNNLNSILSELFSLCFYMYLSRYKKRELDQAFMFAYRNDTSISAIFQNYTIVHKITPCGMGEIDYSASIDVLNEILGDRFELKGIDYFIPSEKCLSITASNGQHCNISSVYRFDNKMDVFYVIEQVNKRIAEFMDKEAGIVHLIVKEKVKKEIRQTL